MKSQLEHNYRSMIDCFNKSQDILSENFTFMMHDGLKDETRLTSEVDD